MSEPLAPIQILDVIRTTAYNGSIVQWHILVDRMPECVYTRNGNSLTSNDSGFYDFLGIEPGSKDAFAGRKFTIRLADGTDYECTGQVWSCGAPAGTEPTRQVGIATKAALDQCYVFMGASVSVALLNDWLSKNTPSSDYRKYDQRETLEYWLELATSSRGRYFRKRVSAARARTLRKRGATILRVNGEVCWSPWLERKKADKARRAAA